MKYFTFPMETLNVTQSYLGNTSHYPHTTGTPKDYPIDCAGIDGGESAIFAPVDMKVTAIRGIGSSLTTNTIWLVTTEKVKTPTFTDYAFMTLTHWNDTDPAITKWKVGSIIKQGEIICYEGKDGASFNHIHMVVGRGESNNWQENSNGKWVITGDTKKPEEVMYIDPNFTTTIKNTGGITWQELPEYLGTPVSRNENNNQVEVKVDNLRARSTPNGEILGYIAPGIYNVIKEQTAGDYRWFEVEPSLWIAYDPSWAVYDPKTEDPSNCEQQLSELSAEITTLSGEIQKRDQIILQLEQKIKELEATTDSSIFQKLDIFSPPIQGYYDIYLQANEEIIYRIQNKKK